MSSILRRLAGAAISAVVIATAGVSAHAETLTDALIAAYKNSNLLDQNRALLRAADEDVAIAVSQLRPIIEFALNGTYSDGNDKAVRVSPLGRYSASSAASLTASLILFDNGRNRMAIDAAKENVLATRALLIGVEQNVLLNAVQAYMDVFAALESVTVAENNVRVLTTALQATRDRFEVGEVTRTDVSLAESRLAASRSNLVSARGDLATAREFYKLAVGHYPEQISGIPSLPDLPKSVDAAREIAVRTHPDIMQAQHNVSAAEVNLARAKADYGPRLIGEVGVSAEDDGAQYSSVDLTLSQTLYRGGGLYAAERQARADVQQSRAVLLQTVRTVEQGVGNAWAGLAVARAQVDATATQVQASQLAFEGTVEEARLGARTTLDVLDAEQDVLDARTAQIQAQADQYTAVYAILASVGLLTADHLGLGIPTYDPRAYYNAVSHAPAKSVQGRRLDKVLDRIGRE